MDQLFYPKSVVVIGVSERPDNLARNIVENLFEFQFHGEILLVGRKEGIFFGRKIYPSLDDIPEGIDVAVILTPAQTVPGIIESCGRKKIRWAVIESGGFGEYSEEGGRLEKEALKIARRVKYPVMVKALAGGGGRGLRIAHDAEELKRVLASSRQEALAAFNDAGIYIEKYIENPRHVEVQILGDQSGQVVHLFERDCTVQRRYQKLIEESPAQAPAAPSPEIPPDPVRPEEPEAAPQPSAKTAGGSQIPATDDLVEQVAQRVIAKLSQEAIQSIAWEVVPDLAEALIRKEIDALKAKIPE